MPTWPSPLSNVSRAPNGSFLTSSLIVLLSYHLTVFRIGGPEAASLGSSFPSILGNIGSVVCRDCSVSGGAMRPSVHDTGNGRSILRLGVGPVAGSTATLFEAVSLSSGTSGSRRIEKVCVVGSGSTGDARAGWTNVLFVLGENSQPLRGRRASGRLLSLCQETSHDEY